MKGPRKEERPFECMRVDPGRSLLEGEGIRGKDPKCS